MQIHTPRLRVHMSNSIPLERCYKITSALGGPLRFSPSAPVWKYFQHFMASQLHAVLSAPQTRPAGPVPALLHPHSCAIGAPGLRHPRGRRLHAVPMNTPWRSPGTPPRLRAPAWSPQRGSPTQGPRRTGGHHPVPRPPPLRPRNQPLCVLRDLAPIPSSTGPLLSAAARLSPPRPLGPRVQPRGPSLLPVSTCKGPPPPGRDHAPDLVGPGTASRFPAAPLQASQRRSRRGPPAPPGTPEQLCRGRDAGGAGGTGHSAGHTASGTRFLSRLPPSPPPLQRRVAP